VQRLDQVRPHRLVEIEHFFQTYKLLEDKTTEVIGWRGLDDAQALLREDRQRWERQAGRRPAGANGAGGAG
jgi:inorganic pyrophosphatase